METIETIANKIGELPGREVYQKRGTLPEQIQGFAEAGLDSPFLTDIEGVAELRLSGGPEDYARTSITPVAVKGEPLILYKATPRLPAFLMNSVTNATAAVQAHTEKRYPVFSRRIYDLARKLAESESTKEPELRKAQIFGDGEFTLSRDDQRTRFLFGKLTNAYFENALKPFGYDSTSFYGIPIEQIAELKDDQAIVNYTWICKPQERSLVGCKFTGLKNRGNAFGFKKAAKEEAK